MIRRTMIVVCLALMLALALIAVRSYWVDEMVSYIGPTVQRPGGRAVWRSNPLLRGAKDRRRGRDAALRGGPAGGMMCDWVVSLVSSWGGLSLSLTWPVGSSNVRYQIPTQGFGQDFEFTRGSFRYRRYDNPYDFSVEKVVKRDGVKVLLLPFRWWHFEWGKTNPASATQTSTLSVPITFLLVLLGAYPTYVMVRPWRRRRRGLCIACAYDLTGNESGVCPECGTKVEQKA